MNWWQSLAVTAGLLVIAYHAARILIEVFGEPGTRSHDPATCDCGDTLLPTYDEWVEFQRMLDNERLDGPEDHR